MTAKRLQAGPLLLFDGRWLDEGISLRYAGYVRREMQMEANDARSDETKDEEKGKGEIRKVRARPGDPLALPVRDSPYQALQERFCADRAHALVDGSVAQVIHLAAEVAEVMGRDATSAIPYAFRMETPSRPAIYYQRKIAWRKGDKKGRSAWKQNT